MENATENIRWILTDGDTNQYGRSLGGREFEFKQGDENMLIDLDDYTEEDMDDEVSAFYGSLEELKEECGDDWEFIAAECIFENNMSPTF